MKPHNFCRAIICLFLSLSVLPQFTIGGGYPSKQAVDPGVKTRILRSLSFLPPNEVTNLRNGLAAAMGEKELSTIIRTEDWEYILSVVSQRENESREKSEKLQDEKKKVAEEKEEIAMSKRKLEEVWKKVLDVKKAIEALPENELSNFRKKLLQKTLEEPELVCEFSARAHKEVYGLLREVEEAEIQRVQSHFPGCIVVKCKQFLGHATEETRYGKKGKEMIRRMAETGMVKKGTKMAERVGNVWIGRQGKKMFEKVADMKSVKKGIMWWQKVDNGYYSRPHLQNESGKP